MKSQNCRNQVFLNFLLLDRIEVSGSVQIITDPYPHQNKTSGPPAVTSEGVNWSIHICCCSSSKNIKTFFSSIRDIRGQKHYIEFWIRSVYFWIKFCVLVLPFSILDLHRCEVAEVLIKCALLFKLYFKQIWMSWCSYIDKGPVVLNNTVGNSISLKVADFIGLSASEYNIRPLLWWPQPQTPNSGAGAERRLEPTAHPLQNMFPSWRLRCRQAVLLPHHFWVPNVF